MTGRPDIRSLLTTGKTARWLVPLILIVLLAAFATAAAWNLGATDFPDSNGVFQGKDLRLDLGTTTHVSAVYLLIQEDEPVEVEIYSGSPGDWTLQGTLEEDGTYRQWRRLVLDCSTPYLRLSFKKASGEIGEVAVFDDDRRLEIQRIIDNMGNETGAELIDEQSLVNSPPTYFDSTYFDEIYFVRTAEEHLRLDEAFEWSHPPLGKLIISLGIVLFGSDPFAWRITGVVAAVLMVYLVFLLARRMLGTPWAGLIAALLLAVDCTHLTEARLATGESFLALFLLLMFYFFYRYYQGPDYRGRDLFLSMLCFGLAFSVKWVAIFGFAAVIILFTTVKQHQGISRGEIIGLLGGLGAAVAVYFLAYIPYFLGGHGIADFFSLQFSMFSYHAELEASHPYGSPWWSWPISWQPMWLYTGQAAGNAYSNIALMGNVVLWWGNLAFMLLTFWLAARHRDKNALFIAIPFLLQCILFAAIPRVLFIYHFYPNVIFMVLAATFWLERLPSRRSWVVIGYLGLAVAVFCILYPLISGLPLSPNNWVYQGFQYILSW